MQRTSRRVQPRVSQLVASLGKWAGIEEGTGVCDVRSCPPAGLLARIPSAAVRRVATVVMADVLPTVILGVVLLAGSRNAAQDEIPPGRELDSTAYALIILATCLFPLRRYKPLALFVAELLVIGVYIAIGYPHGPAVIVVIIAAFTLSVQAPTRTAGRAAKSAGAVLLTATVVAHLRGYVGGGWELAFACAGVLAVAVIPAMLGSLLRLSRIASARAKEEQTRRRVEQERLRMAREVHDVVGHGLSIISLHAAVALHVLDRRPEQAQVALEAIRRTSVDALNELRATLAITRAGDGRAPDLRLDPPDGTPAAHREANPGTAPTSAEPDGHAGPSSYPAAGGPAPNGCAAHGQADCPTGSQAGSRAADGPATGGPAADDWAADDRAADGCRGAPRTPQTGLSRLPGLISEVRLCGTAVDLITAGDLDGLPAEVDLAAYRIVQESLTNVLRHAGAAEVRVALHATDIRLCIEVVDTPTRAADAPDPARTPVTDGHGLRGLRERVAELGGAFTAGPRPAGGWCVRTELPIAARAAPGAAQPPPQSQARPQPQPQAQAQADRTGTAG
ncbi:sensor histidine kinase [Frankia sp. R43]|uniref:sensor histidine kinase n=1 Tax=Frankia sp. R43 TaxID=269536 RepID=UPI0007C7ABAA|nr:histidine kinase [Frankia sp. R43]